MANKKLFPNKYITQAAWLIRIRWGMIFFAFLFVTVCYFFCLYNLNYIGLYSAICLLLLLNILYYFDIIDINIKCEDHCEKFISKNIIIQIICDYLILTFILHFSGGIENPCIVFYIFHMILSSILLSEKNAYLISSFAIFLFLTMVLGEFFGIFEHYSINKYITLLIENEPVYFLGALLLFVLTSILVTFFVVKQSKRLKHVRTLLKQSNDNLLQKDKIKDEFIQRITHDIKGDLAVIQSTLSVIDKQILGVLSEGNATYVKKALNRTHKIADFFGELLLLTQMRLANRFDTAVLDLGDIIKKLVTQLKTEADKKNINLMLDTTDELYEINGMKISIEEALLNLIQNAIKYTPDGGQINIILRRCTEKIFVEVSDTGYGIPESDLPHIFEEFYRAGNVKKTEGTGLGLSLVKTIIERHNGTIDVESKENIGTKFTIVFDAQR